MVHERGNELSSSSSLSSNNRESWMNEPILRNSLTEQEEPMVRSIPAPLNFESSQVSTIDENITPVPVASLVGTTTTNIPTGDTSHDDTSPHRGNITEASTINPNGINNSSANGNQVEEPPPSYENIFANMEDDSISISSSNTQKTSSFTRKFRRVSIKVPQMSGEGGMYEKLFGETKARYIISKGFNHGKRKPIESNSLVHKIFPRESLYSSLSLKHNIESGKWIVTIDSVTCSFSTEAEAKATWAANACPKMHSFITSPKCHVCECKFAVFRRACHCRNCGVCICSQCSTSWSNKMIPKTFNIKNEQTVKICIVCDWLSHSFREALLCGNHDQSLALYTTGNVNLRTPFDNVKGEMFYPVHAAIIGKNLKIVKWLLDVHYCPINETNMTFAQIDGQPLLSSEGRSVTDIAMQHVDINILRYLIVEKNASIFGFQNLHVALQNLTKAIRMLPYSIENDEATGQDNDTHCLNDIPEPSAPMLSQRSIRLDLLLSKDKDGGKTNTDEDSLGDDACIICFENVIDCVITPCGHQICCLTCSINISMCPVCNVPCNFIRIFRP